MAGAESLVRAETDEVLVTEWRLPLGAGTGHHRHNFDYVVVPLTYGEVKVVTATGEATAEMHTGVAYFRKAGVEHDVVNIGSAPLAFVEVELKRQPG